MWNVLSFVKNTHTILNNCNLKNLLMPFRVIIYANSLGLLCRVSCTCFERAQLVEFRIYWLMNNVSDVHHNGIGLIFDLKTYLDTSFRLRFLFALCTRNIDFGFATNSCYRYIDYWVIQGCAIDYYHLLNIGDGKTLAKQNTTILMLLN